MLLSLVAAVCPIVLLVWNDMLMLVFLNRFVMMLVFFSHVCASGPLFLVFFFLVLIIIIHFAGYVTISIVV